MTATAAASSCSPTVTGTTGEAGAAAAAARAPAHGLRPGAAPAAGADPRSDQARGPGAARGLRGRARLRRLVAARPAGVRLGALGGDDQGVRAARGARAAPPGRRRRP